MAGKRIWYFPDAELPPMGADPDIFGHESIIVMNPNDANANVELTLYWTDRPPDSGIMMEVGANRVICVRATERDGLMGVRIPLGVQYAIKVESDVPVIAQYGRLDVRMGNMAFYTTPGYNE